jgi:hypothetical protein
MHEPWTRAAKMIVRLPQKNSRVSAAHMIEPDHRRKDLPGAMLVVGDERTIGGIGTGHHVPADICLAIPGRLHDDWLHRPTWGGLRRAALGKFQGGLKAFVLEIPAIDERTCLPLTHGGQHLTEWLQVREACRVVDRGRDGHVRTHQCVKVARAPERPRVTPSFDLGASIGAVITLFPVVASVPFANHNGMPFRYVFTRSV